MFAQDCINGYPCIAFPQHGMILIGGRLMKSIKAIKASAGRPAIEWSSRSSFRDGSQMPLAHSKSIVAIFAQHLCHSRFFKRHIAVIAWRIESRFCKMSHVHRMMIASCQQGSAGRGTQCGGMKISIL